MSARRYSFLFRPRWILFHVAVVALIVLMINLGFWQLRRLDERQAFDAIIEDRYNATPVSVDEVIDEASGDLDSVEWRPVEITGEFVDDGDVRIVNRSQNGMAGDNIVSPFRLDDGRIILVNRGFVPLSSSDEFEPEPTGTITVVGRMHPSDEHRRGQVSDASEGVLTEAQIVDIERLRPQLPDGEVVPFYLDQARTQADAYPQPVAEPDLSEGPHLSYAVQWFIFSACVIAGWVLAVRSSLHRRERGASAASAPSASNEADASGSVHSESRHKVG